LGTDIGIFASSSRALRRWTRATALPKALRWSVAESCDNFHLFLLSLRHSGVSAFCDGYTWRIFRRSAEKGATIF
jgi:hypothetical protein